MNYLRQVQRAVDHIEAHLDDDLSLAEVAAVAQVSHWHFQRMFRALTRESVVGYMRSRRLSRARVQLLKTDTPVLDIALAAGFGSQAAFSRAFKRQHGVPPARCRATGGGRNPVHKARVDEEYLRHLHAGVSLEPKLVERPIRHMVGMETVFASMEVERNRQGHVLAPLWDAFTPRLNDVDGRIPGVGYGLVSSLAPGEVRYVAAIELEAEPIHLPDDFVYRAIPASVWAVFTHQGPVASLDHTINYIYACWLVQSGLRHTYGSDVEVYDERFEPGSSESMVDYAIPVSGPV